MYAHRINIHIRPDQPVILPLPKGLPEGEVEVIVLFPEPPAAGPPAPRYGNSTPGSNSNRPASVAGKR